MVTFVDFTKEDEVFFVVPKSHQVEIAFTQHYCDKNKVSISAEAGSVLLFDSTCWHSAGPMYKSNKTWYGVNHQFTRSFVKQQIDYIRLLGLDTVSNSSERVQQMLGLFTRVVTSLDEYYQPSSKRLYRSGQG